MTIKEQLDALIPREAVETREAWRGGPQLSYLSGAYVIARLNEVLGQGNWGYSINQLTKVYEGVIEQQSGNAFTTSYVAQISLWARIDDKASVHFEEVGYGDGTDKKSPGKAHELAVKEAVTDGVKRAAKNLGMSMGLALYFKTQEFVDDEQVKQSSDTTDKKVRTKAVSDTGSSKVSREKIKSAFAVLQAQKKITKEDFVKDYLNGLKTDDLDDATTKVVLTKLKSNFPELGL